MLSCEDKDMVVNKERIAAFNELYLIHLVVNWMMLSGGGESSTFGVEFMIC